MKAEGRALQKAEEDKAAAEALGLDSGQGLALVHYSA
jgi:hypothetical protein